MALFRPFVVLAALTACHPCDLDALDYTPQPGDDWTVSTPAEQGLDPDLVGAMYCEAERRDALYGLLVIKNGHLVAEDYYNRGSIDQLSSRASVTKSYTSALVGLAMEQGCLTSVEQKMIDFFPEHADAIDDPRKSRITIGQLLKMKAGYPWEEADPAWWAAIESGVYGTLLVDIPLTADPGQVHQYSNLSSILLGIVVARACDTQLAEFAEQHLFSPIGAELGPWTVDADGYNMGAFELQATARSMATFGQLYLDDGVYDGTPVISADWVRRSLRSYSDPTSDLTPGPEFDDWAYGYQWWGAQAGEHDVDMAWGHGGNFIFLVDALDMVVVVTADPFVHQHDAASWKHEKAHLNMVGAFISSIPMP